MKTVHISLLVSTLVFGGGVVLAQQAGQAVTLQYGTVESVGVLHNDGKRAGGAVVGGSVQKHHTEKTLNQYGIKLMTGATEIVNSDQNDLIVGDCVVVEEIEQAVIKVRTLCED